MKAAITIVCLALAAWLIFLLLLVVTLAIF